MADAQPATTLTNWIQETVDRGATGAEELHKAIADLPLEVLERNGLFGETAAEVRAFQDRSIGAVYDLVRDVNRRVAELAADLLQPRDDDDDGDADGAE